jgi:MYXO-CTERM domain-containing protein
LEWPPICRVTGSPDGTGWLALIGLLGAGHRVHQCGVLDTLDRRRSDKTGLL